VAGICVQRIGMLTRQAQTVKVWGIGCNAEDHKDGCGDLWTTTARQAGRLITD